MIVLAAAAVPSTPTWWQYLASVTYFAGLAATAGFVVAYVFTVRPAVRTATNDAVDTVTRRSGRLLASGAGLLLIGGYLQVAARATRADPSLTFGRALVPDAMYRYFRAPAEPGEWISAPVVTLLHVAFVVLTVALLVPLLSASGRRRATVLTTIAVPVAVLVSVVRSLPTASSALTLDELTSRVLVQVHIVAGTIWVGGLAFLALLARGHRTERVDDSVAASWAAVWQRFSTVALTTVGAVLVSGLWLIWTEFGHVSQLWSTTFGRFLIVKLAFVLAMIAAGGLNQFWLMPRIAGRRAQQQDGSVWALTLQHFPRVVAIEALLGIAVIAVVPFLTGSPRAQAGDTGAEHTASLPLLGLGALLAITLALSFVATVRASDALARRQAAVSS